MNLRQLAKGQDCQVRLPNRQKGRLESKLKQLARGQDCQVRLPGCLYGPETVVLAHIRRGGTAGVGQKPPSLCGVYACASCHDLIDARKYVANLSRQEIDCALLPALCRTLAIVSREMGL